MKTNQITQIALVEKRDRAIARALHSLAKGHTNAAKVSSKKGEILETVIATAKADILDGIASEFER